MDAVAPFGGNTMQFMQFLHLHLYSPICALRIGAMQPPEASDAGPHTFVHNFVGPAWIRMQSAFYFLCEVGSPAAEQALKERSVLNEQRNNNV